MSLQLTADEWGIVFDALIDHITTEGKRKNKTPENHERIAICASLMSRVREAARSQPDEDSAELGSWVTIPRSLAKEAARWTALGYASQQNSSRDLRPSAYSDAWKHTALLRELASYHTSPRNTSHTES